MKTLPSQINRNKNNSFSVFYPILLSRILNGILDITLSAGNLTIPECLIPWYLFFGDKVFEYIFEYSCVVAPRTQRNTWAPIGMEMSTGDVQWPKVLPKIILKLKDTVKHCSQQNIGTSPIGPALPYQIVSVLTLAIHRWSNNIFVYAIYYLLQNQITFAIMPCFSEKIYVYGNFIELRVTLCYKNEKRKCITAVILALGKVMYLYPTHLPNPLHPSL